jgi:hypothetical protein
LVTEVGFAFYFLSVARLTHQNFTHPAQIVVAHRDRLCRFAFAKIVMVHSNDDTSSSASAANEHAQDIRAINTVFICRMQGRRSAENRKRRRNEQGTGQKGETQSRINPQSHSEETEDRGIDEELEGAGLPECKAEGLDEEMVGLC